MPAASTSGRPLHERVAVFFDELFRLDPLRATATGDHRFDAEWPDMSEDGRRARLAFIDRWEARQRVREPQDEEDETNSGRREAPLVSKQGEECEDHALSEKTAD